MSSAEVVIGALRVKIITKTVLKFWFYHAVKPLKDTGWKKQAVRRLLSGFAVCLDGSVPILGIFIANLSRDHHRNRWLVQVFTVNTETSHLKTSQNSSCYFSH